MANPWDNDEIIRPAPGAAPASPVAQTPTAPTPAAAPAGNPWDNDEIIRPAPGTKPAATAADSGSPQRSLVDSAARGFGIGVRGVVQGLTDLPGMVTDNLVAKPVNAVLDAVRGKENGARLPMLGEATGDLLTKAGLPVAETASERVVQDINRGGASALTGIGTGAGLANAAGKVTQAVGQTLSAAPLAQVASGATGAGAQGLTREGGGGEGAQIAAGVAGAIAPSIIAPRRVVTDAGRQTRAAAEKASSSGYVIPPADLSPGLLSEGLSGFSGKIKTAQVASAKNQTVSNSLARKALGIGDDVDLNIDTLESLRKKAAGAYAPVAGAGTVTPTKTYTDALDDAIKPFVSQSKSFPGMKVPEVVNDIAALRSPQFDAGDALNAIRTMREGADKAYRAGEAQSGKAYRAAASALEDALETHLQGLGQPGADILKGFRDARQQIAKSYTVQNALNPQTGAVNAVKLGADLAKGKPLSGDLRTIAEAGQAFPKSMQALKESPKATSPLDWFGGTAAAAGTGNVLPLAAVAARPAVRAGLLSGPMQRLAIRNAGTEVTRVPEGAGAIAAGVASRAAQAEDPPPYRNRLQAGAAARASGGVVVPVPGGFDVRPR